MNRTISALFAAAVLGGGVAPALAQEATDAATVEGPGYPVGEGTVIHPTVGAEAGFTDNVFYDDGDLNVAGIFRLVAEAAIASKKVEAEDTAGDALLEDEAAAEPAQQKVTFRAGGRLAYTEYLSGDSVVRSQRNLAADLGGNLVVAPQGTVSFGVDERFIRDTRPTNFYSTDGTNRITNTLALALNYQPGGHTMKGGVRWENLIDFFEDENQRFANRMVNALHGRYEWEFFPYSKVFADVSYSFINSMGDAAGDNAPAVPAIKRDAQPIRGGVGIASAITELITVKAHLGWAYASYSGGTGYNTPVLGIEGGFRYSPVGRFVAEYNWQHADSLMGDYYRDHHLGGHVDQQIGRIIGTAGGEVRWRTYHGIPMEIGAPDRDDVILAAHVRASYVFRDWLAAQAEFRTESAITDYRTMYGGEPDNPGYTRNELTAGVRAAF